MMNGVEYTVVDRHWSPFLRQWLYDLRETAGDGENNDVCEDTLASLMKAKKPKKYRYVLEVVEEVHHTTAVESERKLSYDEVKDICETRRTKGQLSLKGVTEVDMWIDSAFEDGKELHENIFAD